MTHPLHPDSPRYEAMREAGRVEKVGLVCSRCWRQVPMLFPYARGETTGYGYGACQRCIDEMRAAAK